MTSREVYRDQLEDLWTLMAELAALDATAVEQASRALLTADTKLAESVIDGQAAIDARQDDLETRAITLLARQQPVATDLRLVVGTFRMSAALARMGGLAAHIAKTSRLRAPAGALPEELHDIMTQIGATASRIAETLAGAIRDRDLAAAVAVQRADDAMDALHRRLFDLLLAQSWSRGVEAAVDAALLGRFYERFADQAVGVARRLSYIITGNHEDR